MVKANDSAVTFAASSRAKSSIPCAVRPERWERITGNSMVEKRTVPVSPAHPAAACQNSLQTAIDPTDLVVFIAGIETEASHDARGADGEASIPTDPTFQPHGQVRYPAE